ncbi:MAG: acyltransferase [Pseudomonadota bacterium]|nr:acyltransferase [Pseudomonadota bacterium]QKK06146.1 MAG: acyltransferase [Pseudomonadota bacterium]
MTYHSFIDGLRAIAVMAVILFHFDSQLLSGGFIGVDIFFVISGFLITGVLTVNFPEKRVSIADFYERRARRILPALTVMAVLSTIAAVALLMPHDLDLYGRSLFGIAIFASNFTFLGDVGYFESSAMIKPLLHTWSIAVEEQFYIIFPIVILLAQSFGAQKRRNLIAGIFVLFLVSLGMNLVFIRDYPEASFYMLHTRAWELLAGALLCLYLQHVSLKKTAAEAISLIGFILMLSGIFLYDRTVPFPGAAAIPPCLGTVLLIWGNVQYKTWLNRFLSNRIFVGIGLISYGLYLYHWPLLVYVHYTLNRAPDLMEITVLMAAVFALATLSYFLIENPVRRRKWITSRKAVFLTSLAALSLTAVCGGIGSKTDGLPTRFAGSTLQYVTTNQEQAPRDCISRKADQLTGHPLCKIGDLSKEKPSFMIWGDSHGRAMGHVTSLLGEKHGVSGWNAYYGGCSPVLDLLRVDFPHKYRCKIFNDAVLDVIKEDNIKYVALVGRWDAILGWEENSIETILDNKFGLTTENGKELTDIAAFAHAFEKTVNALTARGIHVYVVKQVPPFLYDVPSVLAKYDRFGKDMTGLKRPYDEVIKRRAAIENVFETVQSPLVTYIDPLEVFCPDKKSCLPMADERSLYADNNHLSYYGAEWSSRIWQSFFQDLKENSP